MVWRAWRPAVSTWMRRAKTLESGAGARVGGVADGLDVGGGGGGPPGVAHSARRLLQGTRWRAHERRLMAGAEDLRRRAVDWHGVVMALEHGVVVVDDDGRVVTCNPAAAE